MMKRLILFIAALLILCGSAYAETQKVTGVNQPQQTTGMPWFTGTQTVGKVSGQTATTAEGTCAGTVKDSQTDDQGPYETNRYVGWLASEFQAASSYTACSIVLAIYKSGTPSYSHFGVSIYGDDGSNKPNPSNVLGTGVVTTASIPTTLSHVEFTFASSFSIVSGTKYHIVARGCTDATCSTMANESSNFIYIEGKTSDVTGMYKNWSYNGTAWNVAGSYELRQWYFVLKQ
jgi:hypothetical protein